MLTIKNTKIRQNIRKKDIGILFSELPEKYFSKGLEIGGGDGFQSLFLVRYVKKLISTDIDKKIIIAQPVPDIDYMMLDAEKLEKRFEKTKFDFIFSSNTLEHISDIDKVLSSFNKLLDDNGIMIHVMPNRLWVIFKIFLLTPSYFYNYLLTRIIEKKHFQDRLINKLDQNIWNGDDQNVDEYNFSSHKEQLNAGSTEKNGYKKLTRFFWKPPHGVSKTNFQEFYSFGKINWVRLFNKHGFKVFVRKLQCHSPHRFGFNKIRYFFEIFGLCSCYAYIVCKNSQAEKTINLYFSGRD